MAADLYGYSGTPLARKLGIKPDARVAAINAPADLERLLAPLPEGVQLLRRVRAPLDVIVCFVDSRAELTRRFGRLSVALVANGGLWIAWPKQASGVKTDLTETIVRQVGLDGGLVDNKVCAITDVWSGLRFVRRLRDRP